MNGAYRGWAGERRVGWEEGRVGWGSGGEWQAEGRQSLPLEHRQ